MVTTGPPRTRPLLLLAAALATAGALLLHSPAGDGDGADHPATESPEPSTVAASPEPSTVAARTSPAGHPEPWLATAMGYARAFTAPVDHDEWVAGLAPWVTAHLAEQYELADSKRRPRGAVASVETVTPGDYSAHLEITYDTGLALNVRVANSPDGWRVTYVEPVSGR